MDRKDNASYYRVQGLECRVQAIKVWMSAVIWSCMSFDAGPIGHAGLIQNWVRVRALTSTLEIQSYHFSPRCRQVGMYPMRLLRVRSSRVKGSK